jgi:hypothetical protein
MTTDPRNPRVVIHIDQGQAHVAYNSHPWQQLAVECINFDDLRARYDLNDDAIRSLRTAMQTGFDLDALMEATWASFWSRWGYQIRVVIEDHIMPPASVAVSRRWWRRLRDVYDNIPQRSLAAWAHHLDPRIPVFEDVTECPEPPDDNDDTLPF